jgi:outer membrane translocation and assembly module TamA
MAMDAAIFADAGTVADRRDALSLGRMVGDVGIGIRFHSPVATPLRIELAGGREGMRIVFAAHAAF